MFFFFFNELYNISDIQQAFKNVCLDKMLSDGYFDMSTYIYARITKEDMLSRLIYSKSKYTVLYKGSYPKKDNAIDLWNQYFNDNSNHLDELNNTEKLSRIESEAIVNWVYRAFSNSSERESFTEELFKNVKDFHDIKNSIRFSRGVVFNEKTVEVNFVNSISALDTMISSIKANGMHLFFRGHADANYVLSPSVMRTDGWRINESTMYNELLISCHKDFEKCHTHFEKLVEMQHYGLPTRLIDITRNPLVALFFACKERFDCYGEIILISSKAQNIKYPQSDTVSILASLPAFPFDKQLELYHIANDVTIDSDTFNKKAARLLHEVRLEKPAFQADIIKEDLLRNLIVYASMNNQRIVKQDGAFILCGLQSEPANLNQFRYKEKGKTIIYLIEKKERILKQLENFSINHASLFPEIECVSEYIKDKY